MIGIDRITEDATIEVAREILARPFELDPFAMAEQCGAMKWAATELLALLEARREHEKNDSVTTARNGADNQA